MIGISNAGSSERMGPLSFIVNRPMPHSQRLHAFLLSAALLGCLAASAVIADDDRYRVAGVILMPDKKIAVVEKSDGSQQLYRYGDTIDNYTVKRIDSEGIYLQQSGREIFLELEGTPTRLEDVVAILRTYELQISDGNASQTVDYNKTAVELAGLARRDPSEDASEDIRERLNAVLGLPTFTVISAVDGKAVMRPEMAVLLLAQKFEKGRSVRLDVGGSIPGVNALYLTPAEISAPN